jgi:catechol 2,3-dioxygenase-like lactoylglutathione lyase family enzyme
MITGIGHAAFRVRDLARSLHFYCDLLGMERAFDIDRDGKPWITFVHLGDGQFLELFPEPETAEDFSGNKGSYRHIQLEVDDLEKTISAMEARGLPRTGNSPRQGRDGNWQYWLTDPDGNRLELMQMMPDSLHRKFLAERTARTAK